MSAQKTKQSVTTPDSIRRKLKVKNIEARKKLSDAYPHVDNYLKDKGLDLGKLRQHSAKIIGSGIITGSLLLSPHTSVKSSLTPKKIVEKIRSDDGIVKEGNYKENLTAILRNILPKKARPLERNEEKLLEQVFEQIIGIKTRANLEGEHLNTTYGYIGAEQHLRRYPGDVLINHIPKKDEYGGDNPHEILKEGVAPGLGAWGYFAPSKEKLTSDLVEIEKWHAVVQTLYLPDWNTRTRYLRDWYKYRKVLIVNANNGKAVVSAIADSGPAAWTGKHFGGSPEVMDYLGGAKYKKGLVVLFFVDDPENNIQLGPVEY